MTLRFPVKGGKNVLYSFNLTGGHVSRVLIREIIRIIESMTYHLYSENDSLLSLLALTETDIVLFRQSHVNSATVLSKKCQSLIVLMCLSQQVPFYP